jgi:hypothetical protein
MVEKYLKTKASTALWLAALVASGFIFFSSDALAAGKAPAASNLPSVAPSPVALASPTSGSPSVFQQASDQAAVGHALGGSFQSGLVTTQAQPQAVTATTVAPATETTQQVLTTVVLDILGAAMQALSASESPPNTINGTTYTEFYSFGKRVFSQSAILNFNGNAGFEVGLAPAEIRVPLIIYPIGPVALEIDGGARFQADLQGQTITNIGIPISLSQLGIQLQAVADGAGFIEGYANLLVVRAGVGGQVNLVDAQANLNAEFSFNGIAPYAYVNAMVDFLSGNFYAFLDYFDVLALGWKRLLNYNLYSWNGYCFATETSLCPK